MPRESVLRTMNLIAYAVALTSIFIAVVTGLLLVWGGMGEHTIKVLCTCGIFFVASAGLLQLNNTFFR